MKTIYILVTSFLVFASSCKEHSTEVTTNDVMNTKSADGSSNTALPDMKFEEETHDFGRITQGEKVAFAFRFKNTGSSNLIVSSAHGSCGCTIPEYPKKPILPGEEGIVKAHVTTQSANAGVLAKMVNIVANTEPSRTEVVIRATILDK